MQKSALVQPRTSLRQNPKIAVVKLVDDEARASFGVPSAVLQLGDIGIGRSQLPRALPDDDYVVLLLRTCVALRSFPRAPWAVSIMAVHECADMLAALASDAPSAMFTSAAREVKGNLVRWATLCDWLTPALPAFAPLSLEDWRQEVARVAELDETELAGSQYPTGAAAFAKRTLMLLPAIDQEFSAEERRRARGDGADGPLLIWLNARAICTAYSPQRVFSPQAACFRLVGVLSVLVFMRGAGACSYVYSSLIYLTI